MYHKNYHIHFVGVGGIGMSGIAELLHRSGYRVSGSDLKNSETTQHLKEMGVVFHEGHLARNIKDADVIVRSTAIESTNPELVEAVRKGIPVIGRAEMLAELMKRKFSILVAGAHGKTSTTGLITYLLKEKALDPTVVIGGKLLGTGTNAILGRGDFFIAEADESDGSFLNFTPSIAVITNIDKEHLDFYENLEHIKQAFFNFINRISFYGLAILCMDDKNTRDLIPHIGKRYVTYGIETESDFMAEDIVINGLETDFSLIHGGCNRGKIRLAMPGLHNVYNALASIAVASEIGFSYEEIKNGLSKVKGVKRRLEVKGEIGGITIIDDYGHHPTEIKTTLRAVRSSWPQRRIVTIFQPHRFSRTSVLFEEFSSCFGHTDIIILTPIYSANEKAIEGIDSEALCKAIEAQGHSSVFYAESFNVCKKVVYDLLEAGDIILTLGAGDIVRIGEEFVSELLVRNGE